MKIWILLGIVILLVLWGLRERFEATMSIKAPPYDDTEKMRIFDMLNNADQTDLIRQAKQMDSTLESNVTTAEQEYTAIKDKTDKTAKEKDDAKAKIEKAKKAIPLKAASIISAGVETFFTTKYKPATVPITNADVETYVRDLPANANKQILERILKRYFVGQSGTGTSVVSGYAAELARLGQQAGYAIANQTTPTPAGGAGGATASTTSSTPAGASAYELIDPICPSGTTLDRQKRCLYPGEAEMFTCPNGYVPASNQMCRKQGSTEEVPPVCPPGKVFNANDGNPGWGCVKEYATATCPSGTTEVPIPWGTSTGLQCKRPLATTGVTAPPGSGGIATTTGTTTGGSSASSLGPTSGGGGRFGIWGPISGGRGEGNGNGPYGNSTTTTEYPTLLGGMNSGGDRTRIDGIGLTEPSKNWKLSMSGMLPSSSSLGSDELSKYLPWSRSPGDMDKVPDPYRVSRTFTTSSYSSKTEPVPFLADFSAFQR